MADDYAEHSASNPPPDDLNSPARQALRDSLAETITRLPAPAAGRYVLDEGKGILRPALRWQYAAGAERQNQLVPPEYLLMMYDQEYAVWLPHGWTLAVFPVGWTLPHVECWLDWAETTIMVEEQGEISPSTDRSSLALATPRRLVTHAYLIVHHLGFPDPPSEPRQPLDLAGYLAELREVRAFICYAWQLTSARIDLDQIAALVHRKKTSMGPYKRRKKDPLPPPDFEGGGGERSLWNWSTIRPWLLRNFPYPLPQRCPYPLPR
jgi:hypothetical protein